MKQIETEIDINAPAGKVWSILTDYENHGKWNPFIKSITGDKNPGGSLTIRVHPPEGSAMTFKPLIIKYDSPDEFRWKGKLGIPGLFDGEHYFVLKEEKNKTRFIHGEKFTGLLVGIFGKTLEKTRKGFELMNEALKAECEKSSRPD